MPLAPIVATHLTTPQQRSISVFAGGRDVTADVKWDSLVVTDSGSSGKGVANLHLTRPLSELPELVVEARLRMVAHADGEAEAYTGYIRSRRPGSTPGYSGIDLIADDIGGLLDAAWIPSEVRPAETLQGRIGYLWGKYAGAHLSGDLSLVAAIGGILPAQNFAGVTLRQAIEQSIGQASSTAVYYVDAAGRLHVFTSEVNAAPFDIDAAGVAGIAPHDLSIDFESASYANRVYVQGATPAGSGFFQDDAAIAEANGLVRTAVLQAPDCETRAMALALGRMYLGRVARATPRGSFSVTSPHDGWRGGQSLTVTSADHGLDEVPYLIARVTTTIVKPGANLLRRYHVEFGSSRAGSARGESISSHGGGQVVSGQLGGESNVYVTSEGLSVTNGSVVRAHFGALGGGDFGLRVVAADGSTVIIDGTSNMFKIAATGTMSVTVADGADGSTVVTLTGLGALPSTPAHLGEIGTNNLSSSKRRGNLQLQTSLSSPIPIASLTEMSVGLNGSNEAEVTLFLRNQFGASQTHYGRYYVFQETAI